MNSLYKKLRENHETIQRLTAQMQNMQGQMNSMNDSGKNWNQITSGRFVSRSQSISNASKLLFYAAPQQNACHLAHGMLLDQRKTFLEINFLRLIRIKIIIKEFIILRHQVLLDRLQGDLSQEMKIEIRAQFQCRHLQEGRRPCVHYCRWRFRRMLWLDSKDRKYRNFISIKNPSTFYILM